MKIPLISLALLLYSLQIQSQNAIKPKVLIKKADSIYISDKEKLYPIDEKTITVRLKPGMKVDNKFHIERQNKLGYIDIQIPNGYRFEEFAIELNKSGCFDIIEYNSRGKYYVLSNDPYASQQWYLDSIGINSAWNITMGSSNIKVAILDSGVDYTHSDLGYGNDSYKNIDESLGWNYVTNNQNVITSNYHGTIVAGIIGAKTNNGYGISGITGGNGSLGVTIIPLCVGISAPVGSTLDDAIIDAVDKGAKIIQLSLNIGETDAINAAIEYAYSNNVTIVCATGNGGNSNITYPASHSKVIAVGATDNTNHRANFSNYGEGLDLVAPGTNIYSTIFNNGYLSSKGTSFSAPQVSGVIALMLSVTPTLTPEEIRNILRNTAKKNTEYTYTNGWNNQVGYGLLNAYAAVIASIARLSTLSAPSTICTTGIAQISNFPTGCTVNWSVSNSCMQIISGQGTDSVTLQRNDDGWATLTATISHNGTVVKTLSKEIMVGTPAFCMNVIPVAADGSQGYWRSDLNGNSIDVEFVNSNARYPNYVVDLYRIDNGFSVGTHLGHWVTPSLSDMTFGYYPQGWYYIEVVGVNDCGTSEAWGTELECVDGNDLQNRMFSFVYDQSSAMLTVTLNPASERSQGLSRNQSLSGSASAGSYEVQLWNENTLLRSYKATDAQLQIPMSGMKSGLYVVRAIINGKTQQRKLIKK